MSAAAGPATAAHGRPAVRAVLFDLDGTLLDTVEDIASALNSALIEARLAPLPVATVREFIGRGAPILIERALARTQAAGRVEPASLLARFHFHHDRMQELNEDRACAFPGVAEGLASVHALGLRLGVVTNKPRHAAAALLERLGLSRWIELVVGGDSCAQRKPHPEPLLHACQGLQVSPAQALMVGDSSIDVQAARAAGMRIVCVPYGYNEGNDPRSLPCDALVDSLGELPALLAGPALA